MKQWMANGCLLLAALIWGFAFVAQSVGMDYGGPFTFQAARNLLGAVALLPLVYLLARQKQKAGMRTTTAQKRLQLKAGILCGLALCLASNLQQIGIGYTTVGKAGFITSMYLVLVPVFGIFLRQRVPGKIWFCVTMAAFGLYLLSITEALTFAKGDLIILGAAVAFAGHILIIDHYAPKVDGVLLSCTQFLVTGIGSGILMFLFEAPTLSSLLDAWLPIAYAGILSCGGGYTLQILGQKHAKPTTACLLMSLESVFSLLAGIVLLQQIPTLRESAGCVLMFAAVLLAQLPVFEGKRDKVHQS